MLPTMTEHSRQAKKRQEQHRRQVVQNNIHGFNKLKVKINELEQKLVQISNEKCELHAQNITHNTFGWLCKTLVANIQQQTRLARIKLYYIFFQLYFLIVIFSSCYIFFLL